MTIGHAHGRHRSVDIVDARLDSFDVGRSRHTRGGVALHVNRYVEAGFESADQVVRHIRFEQTRHVFNTQAMGAHVFNLLGQVDPQINRVYRADRVRNGALGVLVHRQSGLYGRLQVAHVVHGVEYTEYIHAVDRSALNKFAHHIVCVVAVAEDVLAAEQHLLGCIGHRLLEQPDTFPGVFAQIANARVKGRATPGL